MPASAHVTGRLIAGIDAADTVFDARARAFLATWGLLVTFVLVTAQRILGAAAQGTFAIDLRIYRAAAEAVLHGDNPWLAGVSGLTFAGPPPTLLPYLPAALLPENAAIAVYGAITVAAALIALRSLRLPIWWLLFPPISDSMIVLNPDIVVIALLVGVPRFVSLAVPIKIYAVVPLALTGRWPALVAGLIIWVLSLPWWSAFFGSWASIEASLGAQSYGGASAWGSWLMVPTVLALVFLWKRGAEWLTVPAIWPYTQLHYAAIALPIAAADAVVAFLLSFPVLYLVPIATVYYALRVLVSSHLAAYRSGATRTDPSASV